MNRRGFLGGLLAAIAAPAIIRTPGLLMSISAHANDWVVCDGRMISRSVYRDLFKVIGTFYGSGDDITTFRVPDLRSSPIGTIGYGNGVMVPVAHAVVRATPVDGEIVMPGQILWHEGLYPT